MIVGQHIIYFIAEPIEEEKPGSHLEFARNKIRITIYYEAQNFLYLQVVYMHFFQILRIFMTQKLNHISGKGYNYKTVEYKKLFEFLHEF